MGVRLEAQVARLVFLCSLVLGCATFEDGEELSAALTPPATATLKFCAKAAGTQDYECIEKDGKPAWSLVGPLADLIIEDDQRIHHYADKNGVYWESEVDHSTVKLGTKTAEAHPEAIPWLLIKAERGKGHGMMSDIIYIQRLETTGGLAPDLPCKAGSDRQKVSYTARYCFFH